MPGGNATSRQAAKRIIVDDVTIFSNKRFSKTNNWLKIEQPDIGLTVLEHSVAQLDLFASDVKTVRVFLQRPIQIFAQLGTPFRRQYILDKQKSVAMERFNPFLNLFLTDDFVG